MPYKIDFSLKKNFSLGINGVNDRKKSQFVRDLENKQDVNDYFLVKYIAVMEARDGRSYLNVVLADKTGDLEARLWTNAEETAERIKRGEFVFLQGKMNLFQGRLQVIIGSLESVPEDSLDRADFVERSQGNADQMFSELLDLVGGLEEVYIRDLLNLVLSSEDISSRLKTWQAGKTIHHAYESGLLEHIVSCCQLGNFLSAHYKVNRSYVIAGCILHDLCKIYELTNGSVIDYTEEGKLVGHLVKGLEVVDRFSYKIKNFPHSMRMHLKHILLSHHGEYEYGSPKIPQTREAYLVHLVDYMDSKMNALETIIKKDNTAGHWSSFQKTMDRIIFKDQLPSFTEYIKDDDSGAKENGPKSTIKRKEFPNKELKQSLGDKLKDFKINSES
jgi:3'-5' exoribonuclease